MDSKILTLDANQQNLALCGEENLRENIKGIFSCFNGSILLFFKYSCSTCYCYNNLFKIIVAAKKAFYWPISFSVNTRGILDHLLLFLYVSMKHHFLNSIGDTA